MISQTENKTVGKSVFVPPGKMLPRGIFIPSSGVIKLNPTVQSIIPHKLLQKYLKQNPMVNRIILQESMLKKICKGFRKWRKNDSYC